MVHSTALFKMDLRALASSFQHPTNSYNTKYIGLLENSNTWPVLWTTHDYADVDWGYSSSQGHNLDLYPFDQSLYNAYHNAGQPIPSMWITEAAVHPTDGTTTYQGMSVNCPEALPGEPDHWSGSHEELGACLDGNINAQGFSAGSFVALILGGLGGVLIDRTYWYQLQVPSNSTGWDSGMIAADGTLRQSYCQFVIQATCSTSSYEASHYSSPGG
jgi:hypothetical protein